ncbi:GGDEF domain-containing protein [Marinobacter lipolyticus]|uniref:sensor domain-containing diguanylate cyclase n=1 Tax=Marinobacter lipolyticus TaxID=209639 RepID=UPI001BCAD4FE|nr:diguanylate cyclase [Marinobacter lipolyticus]MBS8241057.1 GGDEF domain-containing protein [Marinobacter lipolyticus]
MHLLTALLVLVLLMFVGPASADLEHDFLVILDENASRIDISRHLSYYEDAAGTLNIASIIRQWPEIASSGTPDEAYNFGFSDSVYWFQTRIENHASANDRWVIEGLYPIIDKMEVFFVKPNGVIERQIAGDSVPFTSRPRDHHNINFYFELPQGESLDVFFRVQTSGAVQMRLLLWGSDDFSAADHQERFVLGLYYGLLVCMALFNLLIFLSIRDVNYLWYVSYIGFYGLLQFTLNGLAFEHLWPESTWWNNRAVSFLIAMGMFSILGFSRSFLALKQNAPGLERVFRALLLFFPVMAVAALVYPAYAPVIRVTTFMAAVSVLFILVAGALCLYRRFKPARYFMIAWTALLAGMMLYTFKTFGLIPANFITEYAIQIGSAFEVVLLSIALADRMRHLMLENQQIQKDMTTQLEQRVAARTSELEVVNRQLAALSSTDGLTGVYNRRYFDKRLAEEASRCSRQGPLSLLMIDVDHFKRLNDSLGHQAGDACLQRIARALESAVRRDTDAVARYGGEEFALILPATDSRGATVVAESIRLAVCRSLNFHWRGRPVPVSVSVGVTTASGGRRVVPENLVALADEALYQAKSAGRNTVCFLACDGAEGNRPPPETSDGGQSQH